MPTYELKCKACGHRFELFRTRLLRDDDRVCPICGSIDVARGVGGGLLMGGRRDAYSVDNPTCGKGFR